MFKTPRYIVCYSSSSPKPVKRPANPIWCNCQNICTWERLKPYWERSPIFWADLQAYYTSYFSWNFGSFWDCGQCKYVLQVQVLPWEMFNWTIWIDSFSLLSYKVYSLLERVAWFFCHHSKMSVTYWFFPCVASYGC